MHHSMQKPRYLNMDMRNLGPDIGEKIRGFGIPCRSLKPEEDLRGALLEAWNASAKGPKPVIVPILLSSKVDGG